MEHWLAALFHVNRNWDEGILGEIFIPEVRGKKSPTSSRTSYARFATK
jgi:hypothetical protein